MAISNGVVRTRVLESLLKTGLTVSAVAGIVARDPSEKGIIYRELLGYRDGKYDYIEIGYQVCEELDRRIRKLREDLTVLQAEEETRREG